MKNTFAELSEEDQAFCKELAERTGCPLEPIAHMVFMELDKESISNGVEFCRSSADFWDCDLFSIALYNFVCSYFPPRPGDTPGHLKVVLDSGETLTFENAILTKAGDPISE